MPVATAFSSVLRSLRLLAVALAVYLYQPPSVMRPKTWLPNKRMNSLARNRLAGASLSSAMIRSSLSASPLNSNWRVAKTIWRIGDQ